jgi:hypothetical protein
MTSNVSRSAPVPPVGMNSGYTRFLLLVAGLGGLLYGVDVGIIGGAPPYLEAFVMCLIGTDFVMPKPSLFQREFLAVSVSQPFLEMIRRGNGFRDLASQVC